jgi:hypothetical protein
MTATEAEGCLACERRWRHCHGTWIAHRDAGECTDPACVEPAEAHDHQVSCHEADRNCSCE